MYDNYVSLGENCEPAFQIRRILGGDSSSFFSWNVTGFEALGSLLRRDFAGVMQLANFESHGDGSLLRDRSHDYLFHSPFERDWRNDERRDERLAELTAKFRYLVDKFRALPDRGRTAFFYETDGAEHVRRKAGEVAALLGGLFRAGNFTLVVLQDAKHREADWAIEHVRNRYLDRLAPWYDASDGHVSSWDRVFTEFPARAEMRFSGY